jgi:beta-galactosidase
VKSNGELTVRANLEAETPENLKYMPRYGISLALDKIYNQVSYYGRGPYENYIDRNTASFVGFYQSNVSDFYFPYIRPQENGYRTDVRFMKLQGPEGNGMTIKGYNTFCFSALHNPVSDFDPGNIKAQRHTTDIKPRDKVYLNIDYMQTGVGGDNSWSKDGLANDEYKIDVTKCDYSFTIGPVQ